MEWSVRDEIHERSKGGTERNIFKIGLNGENYETYIMSKRIKRRKYKTERTMRIHLEWMTENIIA